LALFATVNLSVKDNGGHVILFSYRI